MLKIKILGQEYPYQISMGAILRFKDEAGMDASEAEEGDVKATILMLWCGVKAGCSVAGMPFEMTPQQFEDALEPAEFIKFISANAADVKKNEDGSSPR